jgi:L,D-peptidoglycan transpeptidase YkuD (ErfK/YbiS/YcfS/YnhG family)
VIRDWPDRFRKGPRRSSAGAALIAILVPLCSTSASEAELAWRDAQQLVLVTTSGWDADQGVLTAFELDHGQWKQVQAATPVAVGRAGSAWGIGLHPQQPAGPTKKEGDGRSPAGVFRISEAFGYAASERTALPYKGMRESDYCIDVSGSPLYNRIVDARVVGEPAVKGSTEPMRRDIHADGDIRYKLGFVIEHNTQGAPQAGSCIFAHLRRSAGEPTSGCTSMDEPNMRALLEWLRPERHPVFVLLPQPEYERVRSQWKLP